eukprot:TRINITY_DN26520_c0_g2_i1.p1 TRINITY_DN26520_c0_g2~~TRINITY_DN26520_c0_g2_i1.p1  ORF type:complete len:416 (+),score=24.37 TRINITY_DN26520_c0_g2_i1:47-1294(+)
MITLFVVLLCVVVNVASAARANVGQHTVNSSTLLEDIVLLSGGTAEKVLTVIKYGIPKFYAKNAKLGPGLYTTVFQGRENDWIVNAGGKPWVHHVWNHNSSIDWSETNIPYVLVLQLLERATFGMAPRAVWYGSSHSWIDGAGKKRECSTQFDALFIPPIYDSDVGHNHSYDSCNQLRTEMEREGACKHIPFEVLKDLIELGCVQELKINPGREHVISMVALAVHNRRAGYRESTPLHGRLVSSEQSQIAEDWLCPRVLSQEFRESTKQSKALRSRSDVEQCGAVLAQWLNSNESDGGKIGCAGWLYGFPSQSSKKECDVWVTRLRTIATSLARDLPSKDRRRGKVLAWWKWDNPKIHKLAADVIRESACGNYRRALKALRLSNRTCKDANLEVPAWCEDEQVGSDSTNELCSWL